MNPHDGYAVNVFHNKKIHTQAGLLDCNVQPLCKSNFLVLATAYKSGTPQSLAEINGALISQTTFSRHASEVACQRRLVACCLCDFAMLSGLHADVNSMRIIIIGSGIIRCCVYVIADDAMNLFLSPADALHQTSTFNLWQGVHIHAMASLILRNR